MPIEVHARDIEEIRVWNLTLTPRSSSQIKTDGASSAVVSAALALPIVVCVSMTPRGTSVDANGGV